ncbi:hypothetical protein Taro_030623 [Colocasia esculenta]|uniref:Uncharacterized protein n=1 Tax=Colocasia esculenta TaxID=4460 RepID=A0A843VUJ0_COLES|nr:hypothetical protein [Colocasia esculenta]
MSCNKDKTKRQGTSILSEVGLELEEHRLKLGPAFSPRVPILLGLLSLSSKPQQRVRFVADLGLLGVVVLVAALLDGRMKEQVADKCHVGTLTEVEGTISLSLCPELGQPRSSTNSSLETVTLVPFTYPKTELSEET